MDWPSAAGRLPQAAGASSVAVAHPHRLQVTTLSRHVLAGWWDEAAVQGKRRLRAGFGADGNGVPVVQTAVPTDAGGQRRLIAVRLPAGAGDALSILAPNGQTIASGIVPPPAAGLVAADATALLDGLTPRGRYQVLRFVIESCASLFQLGSAPGFAATCRTLVRATKVPAAPLVPCACLTDRFLVAATRLSPELGAIERVIAIGRDQIRTDLDRPWRSRDADRPGQPALFPLDGDATAPDTLVLAFATGGWLCRRVAEIPDRCPDAASLESQSPLLAPSAREALFGWLAGRAADPAAQAASRELQRFRPLPARAATANQAPLGFGIDLAVPDPDGGIFVAGWLHDPGGLAVGLEAVGPGGTAIRQPLPGADHRFARSDLGQKFDLARPEAGRVGFITRLTGDRAGSAALEQCRIILRLGSGAGLDLTAPTPPITAAAARAAVLGAVPLPLVTPAMLEQSIAPAAAALHALATRTPPVADWIGLGRVPPRPLVSVMVPLYRTLDFLRFQIAGFARDPDFECAELITVLDSPEDRPRLEPLLAGLHRCFGLPLRLAVMPVNRGFAAACNVGAAGAAGRHLLFLNSDVIPDRPGWLSTLVSGLEADPGLAAVGAKLLYEDDSLQHAGMVFDRNRHRRWENRHPWKGLPRRFPPAQVERPVPALTGACLLVPRHRFEAAGGFSEDYIIGDFEDSDLCLRLRAQGGDLRYLPAAELYHLERRSMPQHPDHARGVATLYNEWLHTRRWDAAIADLMSGPLAPVARSRAPRAGNRRPVTGRPGPVPSEAA